MRLAPGLRAALLATLAGALLLAAVGRAAASDLKAELADLKVAYLYNFAQFTEWPREAWVPGSADFVICATSREGVGAALSALQGRRLRGSAVVVLHPRTLAEARRCHLLYSEDGSLPWLNALAAGPVLVIGETPAGPAAALSFELRGDRLRWNVNLAPARKGGLRISSKLIELALRVSEPVAE